MADESQSRVEKFTISLPHDIVQIVDDEAEEIRARDGAPKAQRSAAIRAFIMEAIASRKSARKKNRK